VRGLDAVGVEPTGVFFNEQSVASIVDAVQRFESNQAQFVPATIRQHAERFSVAQFRERYTNFVDRAWDRWCSAMRAN